MGRSSWLRRIRRFAPSTPPPMAGRGLTVRADDVYLVSYPRSGNTWMRFMLSRLLDPVTTPSYESVPRTVPDIYEWSDEALDGFRRPRLLKSHEYFDPRYPRTIYLVRHPADVAISYHTYLLKRQRIPSTTRLDEFVATLFSTGGPDAYGSWGDHVGSWLGARQGTDRFLLLRYEDLHADPLANLRRVAAFAGLPGEEDALRDAIVAGSSDRMRALAENWRTAEGPRPYVGPARVGRAKEALGPEAHRRISTTFGRIMDGLGYE